MRSHRDIHIRAAQSIPVSQKKIMGFADLSIAEIAADYSTPVEPVLLCDRDRLVITLKTPKSVWL